LKRQSLASTFALALFNISESSLQTVSDVRIVNEHVYGPSIHAIYTWMWLFLCWRWEMAILNV